MTVIVGLVIMNALTLVALISYLSKRDAVKSRQFLCMFAGCLTMSAGRILDPVLGEAAFAVVCAGLAMVLAGRYWGGYRPTPLWLERIVARLFRLVPERR